MSASESKTRPSEQTDALLWVGGAIVIGLGVTWLFLSKPWSDGRTAVDEPPTASTFGVGYPGTQIDSAAGTASPAGQSAGSGSTAAAPQSPRAALDSALEHDPLRMAQLAFEAGMLVEPEELSAWTLYNRALEINPGSTAARQGLESIADELLKRASVAADQGRFDDARAAIARVRSAIPAHPGASDLSFRIDALATMAESDAGADEADSIDAEQEPAARVASAPPAQTEPTAADAEPAEPAAPPVDPLLEPHEHFAAAVANNRLLTPIDASARRYLDMMIGLDPAHPLTVAARARLSEELLRRANASIVTLDAAAAETWLDEAERVAVNNELVQEARARLHRRLIDAESSRRVPVSALSVEHYVAPRFPARALERAFQGWVDIEFTVGKDGTTKDLTVTGSSHNSFFRREAVDAVEQWRFTPRVYLGETIEQRAYARIRFALD